MAIILKSSEEIDALACAGQMVARVLRDLCDMAQPDVTTLELDKAAETWIRKAGAEPAFKGYRGYEYTICASLNEEVVHGLPSRERKLAKGDVLSLDVGVMLNGFCGDSAVTIVVGGGPSSAGPLLETAQEGLRLGIAQARAGNRVGDISHAVESYVLSRGFQVVRDFVGHGIGRDIHEEPQVPNFGEPHKGPRLRVGMVLAIEPMVNVGGHEVEILSDRWTVVTRDRSLSVHFEHMVAITDNGPIVLTKLDSAESGEG